jgi:type IV secretory pathway VirB10-like protein
MVSGDPPKAERERADLRLHPQRPPVTRLSRKFLIGLAAVATMAVLAAVIWALDGRRSKQETGSELYNTEHKATADELAKLPRDYSGLPPGVPQLGLPLPGDFGRPVLQAHGPQGIDPEQQRVAQETEAARTSRLFTSSTTLNRAAPPPASTTPSSSGAFDLLGDKPPIDADSIQNMQDRKLAFLNGPIDKRTVSRERLEGPASKYVVQAGSVIPAALLTGIRSDLPGQVTGQVTENVYDSPSGRYLLIPQGSKLIGIYDSQVSFGQSRVLLVWTRLIFPNGRSIVLERQPGADPEGYAGLEDQVDYHWSRFVHGRCSLHTAQRRLRARRQQHRQRYRPGAAPRQFRFPQPDRSANRAPQSQCPADVDNPAGIPGSRHRQPRSGPCALSKLWRNAVPKLKLGTILDDRPVKLSIELPAQVNRDLIAYAEVLARETGQTIEPAKLIAPMLTRFMSTDRAFARSRGAKREPKQSNRAASLPPKPAP